MSRCAPPLALLGEGRVTFTELQTLQDSLMMRCLPPPPPAVISVLPSRWRLASRAQPQLRFNSCCGDVHNNNTPPAEEEREVRASLTRRRRREIRSTSLPADVTLLVVAMTATMMEAACLFLSVSETRRRHVRLHPTC